jgi:hypothetical protein
MGPKKKRTTGNQYTHAVAPAGSGTFPDFPYIPEGIEIVESAPPQNLARSEIKLRGLDNIGASLDEYPPITGYRIINIELLLNFLQSFPCPTCKDICSFEVSERHRGAASIFKFKCKGRGCDFSIQFLTSPMVYKTGLSSQQPKKRTDPVEKPDPDEEILYPVGGDDSSDKESSDEEELVADEQPVDVEPMAEDAEPDDGSSSSESEDDDSGDEYDKDDATAGQQKYFYEVNNRLVIGTMNIGRSVLQLRRLLANLNSPPISQKTWELHTDHMFGPVTYLAERSMQDAAIEVREGGSSDITVSADATWQRRGFCSLNGVADVASIETKKILDVEVLTRFCAKCANKKKILKDAPFKRWQVKHQADGECDINHHGSAGMIEPAGMTEIFRRSEKERGVINPTEKGLRYVNYLGDGDSKSYKIVRDLDPPVYTEEDGTPVPINKLECCGHVQKRMGKRLTTKIGDCKGHTFTREDGTQVRGIGGKNGLTIAAVKSIQGHFGAAIRNNKGNLEQMSADIWQIYYHRSGSHDNCGLWCPAKNGDIPRADKHKLPKYVLEQIKPVFEALTKTELLEKCLHGGDQNANECFHAFIWERLLKSTFAGLKRLQLAVAEAVMVFNDGELTRCELQECLGYNPGYYNLKHCHELNERRKTQSRNQGTLEAKETRKRMRMQRVDDLYRLEEKEGGKVYGAAQH